MKRTNAPIEQAAFHFSCEAPSPSAQAPPVNRRSALLITAAAFISTVSVGQLCAATFTATNFINGQLEVPIPNSVEPQPGARQRMIAELTRFRDEDRDVTADESITEEQALEKKVRRINSMLSFIAENPTAEPSLTAVLVIAKCCTSRHKQVYPVALDALQRLHIAHPRSWQAQFAGLLKGRMFYFDDQQKSESERLQNAINALLTTCPKKEPNIDWSDPELGLLLEVLRLPASTPLRAAYLSMIGGYEYMMAYPGASLPDRFDKPWLLRARSSFTSVANQFPNTSYAREATNFMQTIDDLVERER